MARSNKPLYKQIYDHYEQKIKNGQLKPDDRLPTEMEMAELFGVSRITTKRALDEMQREGLVYRKKGQGSFVLSPDEPEETENNKIIAMIIPSDGTGGRRVGYIMGATEYLDEKGWFLTIHNTNDDPEKERKFLLELPRNGVSGIIYYPSARNNFDILYKMHLKKYPIAMIDKYCHSIPLNCVVSDNFKGGYEITKHLIELGHKKIAYMANPYIEESSSVRDRFFGYCKALDDYGLEIEDSLIEVGLFHEITNELDRPIDQIDFFESKIKGLLSKNTGMTGIVAENDYIAVYAKKALERLNMNVPRDISVVGFDNVEMLEQLDISLTTVDQDFHEIGRKAAEIVVNLVETKEYSCDVHFIPVNLIIRASTAPVGI